MPREVPDAAIQIIAERIRSRSNKSHGIPVKGDAANCETPQIFEILDFATIDQSDRRFYAIDGSFKSEQFYNGLCVALYTAGYVCYQHGKQIRLNDLDDPIILGRSYLPERMLITSEQDALDMYEELFRFPPVRALLAFLGMPKDEIFAYTQESITQNVSSLLSFCQEVLEWSLVLEIAQSDQVKAGDFILKDGDLRSLTIRQPALLKVGKFLHEQGIIIAGITKNSAVKIELSYTFKQIDDYLQDKLKPNYSFQAKDPRRQKLCAWFEVPSQVLQASFSGSMYAKKGITGGRGFGIYHAARLDYVEKLQNYDWVIADLNIFDVVPGVDHQDLLSRDANGTAVIFQELTRLTQEHYILGYPYPLVEAHNFVSIRHEFNENIVGRVKLALYNDQIMDHVDIDNLFLDIHDRF